MRDLVAFVSSVRFMMCFFPNIRDVHKKIPNSGSHQNSG